MSYIALYREWRPSVFEEVVEQEHIVRTLRNSVNSGRIAHAYLFCGTRGTGKTTMAHIMSRAINCLNPKDGDPCNECEICKEILSGNSMDVLEIDAASNNSVDNVREIRDEVIYSPSRAKFKVYIIDEVHMLSSGAFNALLKTLEEPPKHVVFILATTEPHKLPATILSRCQRFDFRRITVESISKRLIKIAKSTAVEIDTDAALLIARMSDGALRDAISILDQCISLGSLNISYNDVLSVVGIVNDTFISTMVDDIIGKDISSILDKVNTLMMSGKDIHHFLSDLILYFRNLLVYKVTSGSSEVMEVHTDIISFLDKQSKRITLDEIIYIIKELSATEPTMKWTTNSRIILEVALVKLCSNSDLHVDASIIDRIVALENKSGNPLFSAQLKQTASEIAHKPEIVQKASDIEATVVNAPPPQISEIGNGIVENWAGVLKHLKDLGRRTVHSSLLDTKAVILDGGYIGIIFDTKNVYLKSMVETRENLELIEDAIKKVLNLDVKIKCLDNKDISHIKSTVQSDEKNEFVEKARKLADMAGIPLNIID